MKSVHGIRFDLVLDHEKAAEAKLDPELQSDREYYSPSLEYFIDLYAECRIGFSSTVDDHRTDGTTPRLDEWLNSVFWQAADYLGVEIALAMCALCEAWFAEETRQYEEYVAKNGSSGFLGDAIDTEGLACDARDLLAAMLAPDLDEKFADAIRGPMLEVWSNIASDTYAACEEVGDPLTNTMAIEMVLDADRLSTFGYHAVDLAVAGATHRHGYIEVDKFINRHIRLL